MVSQEIQKMINDQIGKEFYSAYLYRAMASFFEDKSMSGFAQWFKVQAAEECEHADKFIEYMEDNNARVQLPALDKPDIDFESVEIALKEAYEHEIFITKSIHGIAVKAKDEDDFRTSHFLNWFHEEQMEEEKNALALLEEYQYLGDDKGAQLAMNKALGERK